MSGYKYCVKFRFSSEFYTQPDWVVVGYFRTLEGAEQELEWQRKTGSKNPVGEQRCASAHDGFVCAVENVQSCWLGGQLSYHL